MSAMSNVQVTGLWVAGAGLLIVLAAALYGFAATWRRVWLHTMSQSMAMLGFGVAAIRAGGDLMADGALRFGEIVLIAAILSLSAATWLAAGPIRRFDLQVMQTFPRPR